MAPAPSRRWWEGAVRVRPAPCGLGQSGWGMKAGPIGLVLLLAVAPAAVRAEPSEATVADAAVAGCLAKAGEDLPDPLSCIGVYANACLDAGRDPSTSGMSSCYYRETEAWETRLNAYYKTLMTRLPREKAARLKESERSWIETRKTTCGFYFTFHDGGSMARPVSAACYNRYTGERALFLKAFADDVADDDR